MSEPILKQLDQLKDMNIELTEEQKKLILDEFDSYKLVYNKYKNSETEAGRRRAWIYFGRCCAINELLGLGLIPMATMDNNDGSNS